MVDGQRFELGRVVAAPGALDALREARVEPLKLLERHASGDWGRCSRRGRERERAERTARLQDTEQLPGRWGQSLDSDGGRPERDDDPAPERLLVEAA